MTWYSEDLESPAACRIVATPLSRRGNEIPCGETGAAAERRGYNNEAHE